MITGAATGLGLESARQLAGRGATVVLGARDAGRLKRACDAIRAAQPAARLHALRLDLSDLDSVRDFAAEVKRLPDVSRGSGGGGGAGSGGGVYCLMLNAGVMALPTRAAFPLSAAAGAASPEEQPDLQLLTNHVGHHLLARLLEPELLRAGQALPPSDRARAVFLASCAHFTTYPSSRGGPVRLAPFGGPAAYDPWLAYGQSKLCNVLDARAFAARWRDANAPAVAVSVHPGVIVGTELFRHFPGMSWAPLRAVVALLLRPCLKTIKQGAATQVFAATGPIGGDEGGGGEGVRNGAYYADCRISPSSAASADDALGRRLWDATEGLVGGGGAAV